MIYNESKYNTHWETKKLSQLGTFDRGKSRHRPRDDKRLFEDGKYPLIQTGEVKAANLYITSHNAEYSEFGLTQSKIWPDGTLCITIAANIAETALLGYPMCFPDSVIGFNAFPQESSELFMHYVFTYIRKAIQNSTGGSIQDNINKEYLESLDFKIPPKPYQDKIVHILSSIDKKIELNNKTNEDLEALAKTIFDFWFVQFEFPNKEGKPYKSSGGKMVWNKELNREIPQGWEAGKLSDIADIIMGQSPLGSSYNTVQEGMVFYQGRTDFGYRFPTSRVYTTQPSRIAEKGDILLSVRAPVGDLNIANENCCIGRGLASLRSKQNVNSYLYYLMQKLYSNFASFNDAGTTFGSVDKDFLYELKILKPLANVIQQFEEVANKYDKLVLENEINSRSLYNWRDLLLPMLMNGQVTFN
ncbi:restriction endonuclease subunit S [Sinanaerobacter sp. ZZT-01]|uniref:restriction endonuclease subunit S n=1 Tax=Sinanaerobacter sp. ZZT-01 TaxID=3111540 RepID=UPI002B2052F2|nr:MULTISPECIES: restriction endonuclease subunit S [Eubacteriales]MEA4992804.1 restriction endonuclease subunit S [Oscillibacter sp.]WRR92759.1 restriction endonuclease subunit S [Sinanaerobacter sp. ZZT-01]